MSDTRTDFPEAPPHTSDEIDLLDLLVVLADNLKLLILGSLAAGMVALGVAFVLPQTFESVSIFNPVKPGFDPKTALSPQLLAGFIRSADVLEQAAQEMGIQQDGSKSQRLKEMESRVSVSVGRQDQLVSLVTRAPSPEDAQRLNQVLWSHIYPLTIPRPKEMARLQEQLQSEKDRLAAAHMLEQSTAKALATGNAVESTARLYGELLVSNSKRLRDIATLESQVEGLTAENLAQHPTLPEIAIKPKKAMIAVAAAVGTGLLLLLFVLGRHALRGASQDPGQADKVRRLRAAFGVKS